MLDSDGREHRADTVLLAVGTEPATDLAERAGLAVDDGVLVDSRCATSAPGVWAAGEVARRPDPQLPRGLRVEHYADAHDHGAAAARNMLGRAAPYAEPPWCWTQQFGVTVQMAGYPELADSVGIEGPDAGAEFTARLRREGRLVATVCASRPTAFRRLRAEVAAVVR